MTSIATMTIMGFYMGIMSNNVALMMNLFVLFMAVGMNNLLTFFNIGSVHNLLALLVFLMLWDLVTLLFFLVMALRSMGISVGVSIMSSLSFTLVISTVTVRSVVLNMRIVTNNMRAMMNLGVFLFTVSVDNMFTLFDISGVYNIFTLIMLLMLGDLMTLMLLLVLTMGATGVSFMATIAMGRIGLTLSWRDSTINKSSGKEKN